MDETLITFYKLIISLGTLLMIRTLVLVMARCHQATLHLQIHCSWSILPFGITRPQWVNTTKRKQSTAKLCGPVDIVLHTLYNMGRLVLLIYSYGWPLWVQWLSWASACLPSIRGGLLWWKKMLVCRQSICSEDFYVCLLPLPRADFAAANSKQKISLIPCFFQHYGKVPCCISS